MHRRRLSGTYYNIAGDTAYITFSGSNWSGGALGTEIARGTYTVNGTTITATVTWASFGNKPGDIIIITIINDTTIRDDEGITYRK